MQYTWNFKLSHDIKGDLKHILRETFSHQQKELEIFLSYYTKMDGAVAENATFEKAIEPVSNTSGKLILRFHKVFYNACLNIHETEKDQMEVEYKIDWDGSTIKLLGPVIEERGMDDI
ncbi:hypothetical protein FKX85_16165 [Echinicola soli]|uniref:Uncharacterized protein n=1 Tax=Echinicola soli TaxID=2591634 RepID=A0A514CLC3_9BACT|nr:hypothetical protein [Echinicola soli]QDH80494.1 hypothetical protein FKX85_16165 [Echinicola soli]